MGLDDFVRPQVQDALVNRRPSWDGVVVHDLVPGSATHGYYFRVSHSRRDPHTREWEIRWCEADRVDVLPDGEPVYKFYGDTWDLPAYPSTVFPWAGLLIWPAIFALIVCGMTLTGNRDFVPLVICTAIVCVTGFFLQWFTRVEPVRGMKVEIALAAVLAAHAAHSRKEQQRYLDNANARPTLTQQYLAAEGPGPLRDARIRADEERARQEQILANQRAIAGRLGIIFPDRFRC